MFPRLSTIVTALALLSTVCLAGIRSEGKYSGVVIFDRWDGCTLYSGVYVMYISEDVKEQLRADAGKCVQIDATDVVQPRNPVDGLIRQFKVLGAAPAAKEWESLDGLKLSVVRAFEDGHPPEFLIRVENVGDKPRVLRMNSLAPTLLKGKPTGGNGLNPADGPSIAAVTRQSFWIDLEGPRMQESSGTWQWRVTSPEKLSSSVSLDPKATFELRLSFTLPPGEYDFLAGYGGGVHENQSIASNRIGFDVRQDGTAVEVKAVNR
ncbi:MAG: hypothetical protein KF777_04555 [Planctomycetaceae bacterium]|nr:hypothetical protein [Planctomycetaceae bacterium]